MVEKGRGKRMKTVEVWLHQLSEPIVHQAKSTYQKGSFFCVYEGEKVFKYPIGDIFRIVESYGTHGGEKA